MDPVSIIIMASAFTFIAYCGIAAVIILYFRAKGDYVVRTEKNKIEAAAEAAQKIRKSFGLDDEERGIRR